MRGKLLHRPRPAPVLTINSKRIVARRSAASKAPAALSAGYPHLCRWVAEFGTLEIGHDRMTGSFIRALDEGGVVWSGRRRYRSLDAALADAEAAIARFLKKELGIKDGA